jgi:hypothetical protein
MRAGRVGGGFSGSQASIGAGRVGTVGGGQFAQGGGFRGDHDRHRGFGRGVGFAAGLAAGSALGFGFGGYYGGDDYAYNNNNYYDDGSSGYDGDPGYVVSSDADPSYCAQRYQSYDPASGTYLGYDGLRHPCP